MKKPAMTALCAMSQCSQPSEQGLQARSGALCGALRGRGPLESLPGKLASPAWYDLHRLGCRAESSTTRGAGRGDVAALPVSLGAKRRAPNNDIRKRIGKQLGATPPHSKPPRLNWAPSWPATSIQASWLKNNAGLAVFTLPDAHRKRMRTSNGIERPIQQELKRRTSKVRVFPNLASLEHLSTVVLVEEKWETETKASNGNSSISFTTISRHQVA